MSPANSPVLCYVTERRTLDAPAGTAAEAAVLETAARAAAAGVDWIQIREPDLAGGALLHLAAECVRRCAPARILVNDRLDVALAAGAGGVHLGGRGLPVAAVRGWCHQHAPAEFLVGASCHSPEEARAAERDGADYLFFGPVFATPSKLAYGPPQGLDRLAEAARAVRIPMLAIGGVTPQNAAACIAAGARGVAAIRWFQQRELATAVAALRAACRQPGTNG
ncbi:MAG TPA: thiamine phosphate synthase [Candidatus Acidoferrales bacterium]|nr:thiamine phosphate synthase [Candidatus Acidoferrales bacterium]